MKDIVEAEAVALSLVLKLAAYKRELNVKDSLTQSEQRDFERLADVEEELSDREH